MIKSENFSWCVLIGQWRKRSEFWKKFTWGKILITLHKIYLLLIPNMLLLQFIPGCVLFKSFMLWCTFSQENVNHEVILKKSSFSLFWFSIKRLVGLKRKRVSRHRLLVVLVLINVSFFSAWFNYLTKSVNFLLFLNGSNVYYNLVPSASFCCKRKTTFLKTLLWRWDCVHWGWYYRGVSGNDFHMFTETTHFLKQRFCWKDCNPNS